MGAATRDPCSLAMDAVKDLADSGKVFVRDGNAFINRCTKPDKKEYVQICRAVAIWFAMMVESATSSSSSTSPSTTSSSAAHNRGRALSWLSRRRRKGKKGAQQHSPRTRAHAVSVLRQVCTPTPLPAAW